MEDQLVLYPQSYLAQGNGDLVQVTDFKVAMTNKGKQVHTQRNPGAGVVKGKPECTVTFNFVIDEGGAERNYWRDVQKGIIRQLRAKTPGGRTLVINGMYTTCDLNAPLEDATGGSCTFVGRMDDVT
ncbi:MAG: hypothetical protein ACOY0T_37495 [Myxococcota bacterium]